MSLRQSETMKLLGSTKSKITNQKNGKNVPHLQITEVILIHCNIENNDYQQDSIVFLQKSYFLKKHSTQNMMKLNYSSLIRIVNH